MMEVVRLRFRGTVEFLLGIPSEPRVAYTQ